MASPIVRQRLNMEVENRIRQDIMTFRLVPGTRLIIDKLANELAVSRTPVRDALHGLSKEGYISYDGIGYSVKIYEKKQIQDFLAVRRALERLSAYQAAERIDLNSVQDLRKLCMRLQEGSPNHSPEFLTSVDLDFHRTILRQAGNDALEELLNYYIDHIKFITQWLFSKKPSVFETTIPDTIQEHLAIVNHLEQKDKENSARSMEEHMLHSQDRLTKLIDEL